MFSSKPKQQIDTLQNELDASYRKVFESIRKYLKTSDLTGRERTDCLNQVLDSFLHSQHRGRQVDEVIGDDHEAFCDTLISAHGAAPDWRSGVLFLLQFWLVLAMVVQVINWLLSGDRHFGVLFESGHPVGDVLFVLLAGIGATATRFIDRKSIFASLEQKRSYFGKRLAAVASAVALAFVIDKSCIALGMYDPETTVPLLASPLLWLTYAAAAIGIQLLKKRIRTRIH